MAGFLAAVVFTVTISYLIVAAIEWTATDPSATVRCPVCERKTKRTLGHCKAVIQETGGRNASVYGFDCEHCGANLWPQFLAHPKVAAIMGDARERERLRQVAKEYNAALESIAKEEP